MEYFIAPNGRKMPLYDGRVITFGLTEEQNDVVRNNLPTSKYDLYDAEDPTDIIAISADMVIIRSSALSADDMEMIMEYYCEIIDCLAETVVWLGDPKPVSCLRAKFKCYQNFGELTVKLKYILLESHTKQKNTKAFSKKLADSLLILSLIRNHPGIKTQEIAERTEMSARSVQRYISTLQATGEWIEYDTTKRGWKLYDNVSILFGDHLK